MEYQVAVAAYQINVSHTPERVENACILKHKVGQFAHKVFCNVILFLHQKVTFLDAQRLACHLAITLQESEENK